MTAPTPRDVHDQMRLEDVDSPEMALAFMLQTHLCYSYIEPGDLAYRVLTERLALTGYALTRREPLDVERLTMAMDNVMEEYERNPGFRGMYVQAKAVAAEYDRLEAADDRI